MIPASALTVEVKRDRRPLTLGQLVRSLDLWTVAPGHYLLRAADTEEPSVPGAHLVAGIVVAAERTLPGHDVRMLSWTPGPPVDPRRPVRIAVDAAEAGASAEVTITQRSSTGSPRRHHGHAVVALAPTKAGQADGMLRRALLAYLGEAMVMPGLPGGNLATLAYSIDFLASERIGPDLVLARSSEQRPPQDGYAHALAQFVTPDGTAVARASRAVMMRPSDDQPHQFPQAFR